MLTGQSSFTPELWGCGSWQGEGRNLAGKPPLRLPAHTSQTSSAPGAEWVGVCVETLTPVRSWSGQCLQVMPDGVGLAEGPRLCVAGCAGPAMGGGLRKCSQFWCRLEKRTGFRNETIWVPLPPAGPALSCLAAVSCLSYPTGLLTRGEG